MCLQEPNLKESAGGLRDFHTALWACYARFGCRTLEELRTREIVTEPERHTAARAVDFLWRVRYAAHLSTRRKTERLALDLQPVSPVTSVTSRMLLCLRIILRIIIVSDRVSSLQRELFARASDKRRNKPLCVSSLRTNPGAAFDRKYGHLSSKATPTLCRKPPAFRAFALAKAPRFPSVISARGCAQVSPHDQAFARPPSLEASLRS